MPSTYDSVHTIQLDHLETSHSSSTRIQFDAGAGDVLVIEPHAPGVFRLRAGPHEKVATDKPRSQRARAVAEMLLAREETVGEMEIQADSDAGVWCLQQGDIELEVAHHPWRVVLRRAGKVLLSADSASQGSWHGAAGEAEPYWALAFGLEPGEAVHGLGETAGDLDRRGETIVSDDASHRSLPLAWSVRGWGVYVNSVERVVHAVGDKEFPDDYRIGVDAGVLDLFLFAGEPAEILNQYTQLTGRAGQPVLWAMGTWLQAPEGISVTQAAELASAFREHGLGLDVVQLPEPAACLVREGKLNLEWDPLRFPDPKQALALFRQRDLHVSASVFPGVLAGTEAFTELEDRGWLVAEDSGDAKVFPGIPATGDKPYALLDLTNKDVYGQWRDRHHQLFLDGLEAPYCNVPTQLDDGLVSRGDDSGAALRTLYPLLARRALFDAVAGHKIPPEGVAPGTDLFPASQRLPWQAAPEVPNSWAGLGLSLRAGLSLGGSAVPVQMHALGNARAPLDAVTPELYVRWLTALTFSGNFTFQGIQGLLPWQFGEEAEAASQVWMRWRYRLIPYVLGAIEDAARTGLPVQRSMALSFPNDAKAQQWQTQFLLGPALLVAPILAPGSTQTVYLPEGEAWWDLNTGWRYEGGTVLTLECGLDQYPVFGREGHMLCLGPATLHTGDFNSARLLDEVWMFGMPVNNPVVMRNKIRVMQMQGSSYIKGLEGLRILPSEGLEVKRRGAEVRISRAR